MAISAAVPGWKKLSYLDLIKTAVFSIRCLVILLAGGFFHRTRLYLYNMYIHTEKGYYYDLFYRTGFFFVAAVMIREIGHICISLNIYCLQVY